MTLDQIGRQDQIAAILQSLQGPDGTDDQGYYGPGLLRRLLDAFPGNPIGGGQTVAVSNAPIGLIVPDQARSAFCTVTTAAIRLTTGGRIPSAAAGHHFGVGEHFTITGRDSLLGLQMIREGGVDGALDVSYFD